MGKTSVQFWMDKMLMFLPLCQNFVVTQRLVGGSYCSASIDLFQAVDWTVLISVDTVFSMLISGGRGLDFKFHCITYNDPVPLYSNSSAKLNPNMLDRCA